jgi:hypothetical protein
METEDKRTFLQHLTPSKFIVLFVILLMGVFGIISVFLPTEAIEIRPNEFTALSGVDKYKTFAEAFAYIFVPLVLSVAGGGAAKNYFKTKSKYAELEVTPKPNEEGEEE